jgi:hypothetical protein
MRAAHANAVHAQADAEEDAALSAAVARQKSERLRDEKLRQVISIRWLIFLVVLLVGSRSPPHIFPLR